MSRIRWKKVLLVTLAQIIALFLAWLFTLPFIDIAKLAMSPADFTGPNSEFGNAIVSGWLGFIPASLFFMTVAHFILYSRPKIYYFLLIVPNILLAFNDLKFLTLDAILILFGFLLGTVIRLVYHLLVPPKKPTTP